MAVTGNTRHPEYRKLTILYEFQNLKVWTRRGITPTDIDGRFVIHSGNERNRGKGDFFLWLDLKTTGKPTSDPQREAFDALLRRGHGNDALIIAEHPPLQSINVPTDIDRFAVRMFDEATCAIAQTEWFPGSDSKVGWWVKEWFAHCEDKANHFITAFRKSAGIYPPGTQGWRTEMNEAT